MFFCLPCRTFAERARQVSSSKLTQASLLLTAMAAAIACGGGHSAQNNLTSSSNSALTISGTLPAATVGSSYSAALTVTGGSAPYVFWISSGGLPNGVTLSDNSGSISGTPSAAGNFAFAVSVSDSKGDFVQKPLSIPVATAVQSSGGGTNNGSSTTSSNGSSNASNNGMQTFPNVQKVGGWAQFGQQGPNYVDCSPSPCNGITFSMTQGVQSPSISGDATEFYLGGSAPYSDGLWNNHLIGPLSSQGTFDTNGSLVPSLHNFVYDVYFYASNLGVVQALEFDINQFFGGMGFIFGHECRVAAGSEWDVWDSQNAYWVRTGIPCYPNQNSWNHLTIQVQRTSDNHLLYQSITLNGQTHTLNWAFGHGSAPNWYGLTINYQMDGDSRQDSYSVYLDNLNFSYN